MNPNNPLFEYKTWSTGRDTNVARATLLVAPGRVGVHRRWTRFPVAPDEVVHAGSTVSVFRAKADRFWNLPHVLVSDGKKYCLVRVSRLLAGPLIETLRDCGFEVSEEVVPAASMLYPKLLERHLRGKGVLDGLQR
jgi:hypothetical protein